MYFLKRAPCAEITWDQLLDVS